MRLMQSPFEVSYEELQADIDRYVDAVFAALQSAFLVMPKGAGFIDYATFEQGYEALKRATGSFRQMPPDAVFDVVRSVPVSLVVLRSILGLSPPEWAYVTNERLGVDISQNAARSLDRRVRLTPLTPMRLRNGVTSNRLQALIAVACQLIEEGAPEEAPGLLHRLAKADTKHGLRSVQPLADLGVPYAMLLYERFLGRPFAGHRDSVSELVGDVLEASIEAVLSGSRISFRKTRRAERVEGFDQAPDFIVPDEFNPRVVIEAKITEDDGTARDKVTRVQHLAALSMLARQSGEPPRFEIVACIAGRGFKQRREDMRKLLLATRGKVFTPQTLDRLVDCTQLREFKSE
jgi:hypothetical protein